MGVDTLDFKREGGLVRQLRFEPDGLVIIDASFDAIAVNWSTNELASGFVRAVNDIADLHKADVSMGLWNQSLQELPAGDDLMPLIVAPGFDKDCQFLRLDLLETQSVFFQALAPGATILIGYADVPYEIGQPGHINRMESLMRTTATPPYMVDEMLETVLGLAGEFKRNPSSDTK